MKQYPLKKGKVYKEKEWRTVNQMMKRGKEIGIWNKVKSLKSSN